MVNANWEKLLRLLYGRPQHIKPALGTPPKHIFENTTSGIDAAGFKFRALEQAMLNATPSVDAYREQFLDACFEYVDSLRVRKDPKEDTVEKFGERIVSDCGKLSVARNCLVDWVLIEARTRDRRLNDFEEKLVHVLEKLLELASKPEEITRWNENWFDAHSIFVYETFLYIVASLLKANDFTTLHHILSVHYILPERVRSGDSAFSRFGCFYNYSNVLEDYLRSEQGGKYYSATAELVHRQLDREDISFTSIMEADALILLMRFLSPDGLDTWWYPGTLHYSRFRDVLPFFLRATRHREFKKLSIVTGEESADLLREKARVGEEKLRADQWLHYRSGFFGGFLRLMNMDKLDTIA